MATDTRARVRVILVVVQQQQLSLFEPPIVISNN